MRRRAEQRRRERDERDQIRTQVETLRGEPTDNAFMDQFFAALGQELGALPPMHILREAIENANSVDVHAIGAAVRQHYRRARRPAAAPERAPVAV